MEEHVELFILFPEYIDEGQVTNAPYINTIGLLSEQEMEKYINNLQDIIEFLTHENYIGYYDMENVRAFGKPLEVIEDCYPNKRRLLLATINKWNNWRDEETHDCSTQYFYKLTPISSETLSEIAKRKKQNANNEYIVVNNGAITHPNKTLPVFNDQEENQNIEHKACECKTLHEWFISNRKPRRVYNFNPKHGENGVGHKTGESSLLCSREAAEKMLPHAVGNAINGPLFYHDREHAKSVSYTHLTLPTKLEV